MNELMFQEGQYNWSANMQGLILGAIYYGGLLTLLIGAVMSDKLGAKWVIGGSVLVSSVMNLLIPLTADWGAFPFLILRGLQGLVQVGIHMYLSLKSPFILSFRQAPQGDIYPLKEPKKAKIYAHV